MRILFVQVHSGIGGATTSMFQLIRELVQRGIKPEVLITGGEGPLSDWLRSEGIVVRLENNLLSYGHGNGARNRFWSFPPFRPITDLFKLPASIQRYERIFDEMNPDLIYLNTSVLWPAALAARRANKLVITHVREVWFHGLFGLRKRFFIRLTERLSHHIFVLSQFSKSQFSSRARDKITVVYNSVDFDRYDKVTDDRAALKAKLGLDPNKSLIIMLGGSLKHKGGSTFLRASKEVLRTEANVEFAVLGHAEAFFKFNRLSPKGFLKRLLYADPGRRFQNEIKRLGIHDKLHIPGVVTNVPEWIKASDILVFPAPTDHFGRPIIEAGYMGIPVIASDTETSKELVPEQRNGLWFRKKSVSSLKQSMLTLLNDREKRERMGESGHELALRRYSLQDQVNTIIGVLKRIGNEYEFPNLSTEKE